MNTVPNLQQLTEICPNLNSLLWDMDGTIMETEPLHIDATVEILNQNAPNSGLTYKEIEDICTGTTDSGILALLQQKDLLLSMEIDLFIQMKSAYIEALLPSLDKNKIFNSNIKDLMDECQVNHIRQAVVTSSEYSVTHALVKYLELQPYFEFIITRADTNLNKPHPEPYLLAMSKLELSANQCLIFEDSKTGLAAAKASKAYFIKANWYAKLT